MERVKVYGSLAETLNKLSSRGWMASLTTILSAIKTQEEGMSPPVADPSAERGSGIFRDHLKLLVPLLSNLGIIQHRS